MLCAAHAKLIQVAMFFSSLHFASYCNINFKTKQVRCLEVLNFGKDVVAVLPKGCGKIMIFSLLHSQCYGIILAHEVLIVVSSLNALMKDLKNRGRKLESDDTWRQKKKKHGRAGALF